MKFSEKVQYQLWLIFRVHYHAVGRATCGLTGFESIFWWTILVEQLHDFLLLSLNSFLHPFLKSKFMKKIPWHQKIWFLRPIFINQHTLVFFFSGKELKNGHHFLRLARASLKIIPPARNCRNLIFSINNLFWRRSVDNILSRQRES